jgi:hypothetical protein
MGGGEARQTSKKKHKKNKIKQHSPDPQMFPSGKRGHLRRVEITYTLVTPYTVVKDITTRLGEFPLTKGLAYVPQSMYIKKSTTVYVPSSEFELSRPLSRQRVCPSSQNRGRGAHSPAGGSWGSPNSDDLRKRLALCLLCDMYP